MISKNKILNPYVIITWPDSQYLMLEDWFDYCIPVPSEYLNETVMGGSYFAPEYLYNESGLILDTAGIVFYLE